MNPPRCSRCARTQPQVGYVQYWCAYCGAPLPQPLSQPRTTWVAHPPPPGPEARRPTTVPGLRQPYVGPPSYRGGHPRWGFPAAVWKPAPPKDQDAVPAPPLAGLQLATVLAWVTAVCAFGAAAMESWRFALLLRGRTEVLLASQVAANDALVIALGVATAALALACAVVAVPAVLTTAAYAAAVSSRAQRGSSWSRVLRFVIPGWNLYGAGEMLAQTDGLLVSSNSEKPTESRLVPGRLVIWWWSAWVINGALVITVLLRGVLGRSLQAAADSVELHIALDVSAGAVAILTALLMRRFRRLIQPPREASLAGWVLVPPASSRRAVKSYAAAAADSLASVSTPDPDPVAEQPEIGADNDGKVDAEQR